MIAKEKEAEILRLYHGEKWPIGTIAAQLGLHHTTVQRVLGQAGVDPKVVAPRPSMVDPFVPCIVEQLGKYPSLRSSRLFGMLKERGYPGGPDHLRRVIGRLRAKKPAEAFQRLGTLPGEQAQVDWAHFGKLTVGRALRPLWAFVMVLSYSRRLFLRFFPGAAMPFFVRGSQRRIARRRRRLRLHPAGDRQADPAGVGEARRVEEKESAGGSGVRPRRHPGDALEMPVELALVVEPHARSDLRLRDSPGEQRPCEADAPVGHVRVRGKPDLLAEGTTEAELVESRVGGELVERDRFGEPGIEELARARHRASPRAARTGRISAHGGELAQGGERLGRHTRELERRRVAAKQRAMQRRQRCSARVVRAERVLRRGRRGRVQRRARLVDHARVEDHDLKPPLALAGVLCEDLSGDLHVDRARAARPARASKRPLGAATEVERGGVAVRHAGEQGPVAPELPDGEAGERSRA
ncbi:hypothetical protein WME82_45815 [Sorangium sp. So ce128]